MRVDIMCNLSKLHQSVSRNDPDLCLRFNLQCEDATYIHTSYGRRIAYLKVDPSLDRLKVKEEWTARWRIQTTIRSTHSSSVHDATATHTCLIWLYRNWNMTLSLRSIEMTSIFRVLQACYVQIKGVDTSIFVYSTIHMMVFQEDSRAQPMLTTNSRKYGGLTNCTFQPENKKTVINHLRNGYFNFTH